MAIIRRQIHFEELGVYEYAFGGRWAQFGYMAF